MRLVLGPVRGWRRNALQAAIILVGIALIVTWMVKVGKAAKPISYTIGPALIALSAAALVGLRGVTGLSLEITPELIRVRPHGVLGGSFSYRREELKHVTWWRPDCLDSKDSMREAPRLHFLCKNGVGRLFGPWLSRDPIDDYRRIAVALQGSFDGDPSDIREPG